MNYPDSDAVNLVLSSKRTTSRRNAFVDEVKSLRGMQLAPMGDLAQRRRPTELLERMKKRVKQPELQDDESGATAGEAMQVLGKKGGARNIVDALQGWEEPVYQPKTKETRRAYETLLTFVQQSIGAQPREFLASGADEVLAILKDESRSDPERRSATEELLGVRVDENRFHNLVQIGKQITDYHDEGGAGDAGLDMVMPVVFDGDEDGDEAMEGFYVKEERDEDDEDDADDDMQQQNVLSSSTIKKERTELEGQSAGLTVTDVDAYWLQRKVSQFIDDAEQSRVLAEQVLDALGEVDPVACENQLVQLLDYERFELVQLLMSNRATIVYATLSKRATSEEERARLKKQFGDLGGVVGSSSAGAAQPMEIDDDGDAAAAASEPTQWAVARKLLDLKELEFYEGSHLMSNAKCVLPPGTVRLPHKGYEEIQIPAPQPAAGEADKYETVPVTELPAWSHPVFTREGSMLKYFNRLQSAVFQKAFYSPENLLIAAPTGSGKTNCAMLTMLHTIGMHRNEAGEIDKDAFKIVYIAPMKSLVQEMVLNFGQRLAPLGLVVRELSGDQNLNKQQINETQVIITTPEKWDIVTRRSGERAYTQLVRLVIIDEVHLLHDERGPVLEAIVARTIRQIEDTQQLIRLVGLSATLPNYQDVAMFLRVPDECVFHFANAMRPVPLEMTFLGIHAKKAVQRLQAMNKICYEQVMLRAGKHQTLVFCHSRKDTAKTARYLRDMALADDKLADILADYGASAMILQSEAENAKNKDLRDLMPFGFGIHHAGMTRDDRTLVEDLFADGHLQVLVSTATLAWGVNLPAHCVIIKGTQVYNPEKGRWVELSGLDVMQMLGRAGRPGYDDKGEGVLITAQSELQFYLSLMNQQLPIESQLIARLPDLLLAEAVLGSIASASEAVDWLAYTYLYICMLRAPTLYGVAGEEAQSDQYLEGRRADLIHTAALALQKSGLISYDARAGVIQATDLGRVAAHYYVGYETMGVYNEHMKPLMSDIELFRVFSLSGEFKNVSVRSEERLELEKLLERVPIPVKETVQDPSAKVNVLLQTYISRLRLEGFALMADMVYVTQSAVRLLRALFEIAMNRGWAQLAHRALQLAQMTEQRMWPIQSPLRQFGPKAIAPDIILALERRDFAFDRMWDLNSQEIGNLIRFPDQGKNVHRHVHMFPRLQVAAHVQPVTRSTLKIEVTLTPDFNWSDKHHQGALAFWVFIEDADQEHILYSEYVLIKKRFAMMEANDHVLELTVPMLEPPPPQYFVVVLSDRWISSVTTMPISFRKLIPPAKAPKPSELLDLRPLSVASAFAENPEYAAIFQEEDGTSSFNSLQTQAFKALYSSTGNVLLAASPGAGLEVCAEIAILQALNTGGKVVYVCPIPDLLKRRKARLERRIGVRLQKLVLELTGDLTTDLKLLNAGDILVTSPESWDKVSRRWKKRAVVQDIALLLVDQLQMLSSGDEGAILEVIVSRMRYISSARQKAIRIVALSSPCLNARDLGDWIGATKAHVFSFHSSVRPVPLRIQLQGFSNLDFSARALSMIRPMTQTVSRAPADKNAIIFVHSVAQAHLVARELQTMCEGESTLDSVPRFRIAPKEQLESLTADKMDDEEARHLLVNYGIAIYHEHIRPAERELIEKLFSTQCIGAVVATATMCWAMPMRAHLVTIMGCQRYEGKEHRFVDYPMQQVLEMIGKAGRPNVDERAQVALFCATPKKEYYKKYCFAALPVESRLDSYLHNNLNSEIVTRTIQTNQDAVDYLTWTFLYRRLSLNPNFYGMQGVTTQHLSEYLSTLIEETIQDLVDCGMIAQEGDHLSALNYGMIAAYYYINYVTIELLASSLAANTRMKGLIEILAAASEFDVIPVRFGEARKLRKLAAHLPMKISGSNFTDGRTKINVLLQAHFSRFALPRELATDRNKVIRDAMRIIDAVVDVTSSEGWLSPALAAMELAQMLVQAMWDNDNQLLQLPHMSEEMLERAKQAEIESIYDFMEMEDDAKFALLKGLTHSQMLDIAAAANRYPSVDVEIQVEDAQELTTTEPVTVVVALEREMDDDDDDEAEEGGGGAGVEPVCAPMFPGERREGWWLVVGDKQNTLYGIKRIQLTQEQTQINVEFMPPTTPGQHQLVMYLMCDSYLGCDQEFPFEVTLAEGVDESDSE